MCVVCDALAAFVKRREFASVFFLFALCPLPFALSVCPLPFALCPLSFALCPLPFVLCPLPFALCPLPFALCPLSFVLCPLSFALCPLSLLFLCCAPSSTSLLGFLFGHEFGQAGTHPVDVAGDGHGRGVGVAAAQRVGQPLVVVEHLPNRGRRHFQHPPHQLGQIHGVVDLEHRLVAQQAEEDPVEGIVGADIAEHVRRAGAPHQRGKGPQAGDQRLALRLDGQRNAESVRDADLQRRARVERQHQRVHVTREAALLLGLGDG